MVIRPRKATKWFINANIVGGGATSAVNEMDDFRGFLGFGLMFGNMQNWGWYTRLNLEGQQGDLHILDRVTITAGLTKRLCTPLYLYTGAGYAYYKTWNMNMATFDLGLLLKPTANFNMNLGLSGLKGTGNRFGANLSVGFGVSF